MVTTEADQRAAVVAEDGVPLPIVTARWRLDTIDGAGNVLSLDLGDGVSFTDSNYGELAVEPPPTKTATVAPGIYRDWLTVTLADGSVFDEWTGIIRVAAAPA